MTITRRDTLALTAGAAASLPAASGAAAQEAAPPRPSLTLLLVNDIYKMGEERGQGGFARLAAIVKAERAKGVPLLYCHAGDSFSPSLMSGFDQGAHIIELLNVAPPDAFVPGNHEFDFGREAYARRVADSKFPYFAANLRDGAGTQLPGHRDRTMLDLGGVKVGLFGLALGTTPLMSQSGDLAFGDEMATVRREAKALREEGADLVVCLAHTDFSSDLEIARSRLVDVLLTGHDHDLRLVYDGRTIMVESGEEGQFVTAIDLAVQVTEREGKRQVTWRPRFRVIDSGLVAPDPEALAIVRRLEGELSRELDVGVARIGAELDSRSATVRGEEAAIGNLIADAVRASVGAEVAIVNGGGIRGNRRYPAGHQLTRRDILGELPFGNATVLAELRGADIKAALENGVSGIDERAGRFPHVSGMSMTVDRAAPVGARIVRVTVGGAPLEMERVYRVASNNFMLAGGDGYAALGRGRVLVGATDGKLLANEVMAHLRRMGQASGGSGVSAQVEGRVVLR